MNQTPEGPLILTLVDLSASSLLRGHFSQHQKFRKLWLERREEHHNFIPIEFSHDKYFLLKHISKLNSPSGLFCLASQVFEQITPQLRLDEDIGVEFFVHSCKSNSLKRELTEEFVVKLARRYILSDIIQISGVKKELIKWMKCKNVILETIRNGDHNILNHVPIQFRNDREIIMEVARHTPTSLKFIRNNMLLDREIIFKAVKRNGVSLLHAFNFQKDKEIVMTAIKTCPEILKNTSLELQNDFEVVMSAVQQVGSLLKYASKTLQLNRQIVMASVSNSITALSIVDDSFKNDREIVSSAVERNGGALRYASPELQNDREIALKAIHKNAEAYEFVSPQLKQDKELAYLAISQNPYLSKFLPNSLEKDSQIQQAIKHHSSISLSEKPILKLETRREWFKLQYTQSETEKIEILNLDGSFLEYLPHEDQSKSIYQRAAILSNGYYIKYSKELFELRIKSCYGNIKIMIQ